MADIADKEQLTAAKVLVMGPPGAGKTCALASLANAGYHMGVIDFDNKIHPMVPYLTDEAKAAGRVKYATLTDKLQATADGKIIPVGTPTSTLKAMKLLNHWKTTSEDLGRIQDWDNNHILVIDTLTFQGRSALRHVQQLAGTQGQRPTPADWGNAQEIQRGLLLLLFSEAIKCNVLVFSHITYLGGGDPDPDPTKPYAKIKDSIEPDSPIQAWPSGLGRAMPPEVPQFFDSILSLEVSGGDRRILRTVSKPNMALKNPRPDIVPREIKLGITKEGHADPKLGLAQYFELILGHGPDPLSSSTHEETNDS